MASWQSNNNKKNINCNACVHCEDCSNCETCFGCENCFDLNDCQSCKNSFDLEHCVGCTGCAYLDSCLFCTGLFGDGDTILKYYVFDEPVSEEKYKESLADYHSARREGLLFFIPCNQKK